MILMIAFVAGIGTIVSAQTRQQKTPQQRAQMMSKKLNLTQDQSAKVNAILAAQAASMDSLKATKAGTDKKQAFGVIRKNTDSKLNAVLNADQQKAYADLKTARKVKMKGMAKAHRQHMAPTQKAEMITKKLQEKLNLTQDQSAKVSTILLAQATRMDSLKANKAQGDKNRGAFKSIRQSTDEQLSAVFTADQKKAYEEFKASHKNKRKAHREGIENKEG